MNPLSDSKQLLKITKIEKDMKNLNILLLTILTCLLMVSCDKEDEMTEMVTGVGGDSAVTGYAEIIDLLSDSTTTNPARGHLIYLSQDFTSWQDTLLDVEPGEVFIGDNYYATRVQDDGTYGFEGIEPFENWWMQIITDIDSVSGFDETPDGDDGEQLVDAPIRISLTDGEHDDGNVFQLYQSNNAKGSVLGQVSIDLNGDGIADEQKGGINLNLYQTDETGSLANGTLLTSTVTFENGTYSFNNLLPGNYAVQFADQDIFNVISSGDESPDADPLSSSPRYIPTFIETNEIDDLNNFLIEYRQLNISGQVLVDSISGIPAVNQRIELYLRSEDGVPMTPLINSINTDANGAFFFPWLEPNEYVLYFIGNGTYECLSGEDTTPEAGEPLLEECFFIAVDIPTAETQDSGNLFILQ